MFKGSIIPHIVHLGGCSGWYELVLRPIPICNENVKLPNVKTINLSSRNLFDLCGGRDGAHLHLCPLGRCRYTNTRQAYCCREPRMARLQHHGTLQKLATPLLKKKMLMLQKILIGGLG